VSNHFSVPEKSLLDIQPVTVEEVTKGLLDSNESVSRDAGVKLAREAGQFGINLREYLRLKIRPKDGLDGYEQVLEACKLPIRNDFDRGITLQLASNSFQTYPGTRAMFPPVIDDMITWQSRQVIFERKENIVAQTRTVARPEVESTIVKDDSDARAGTQAVAEFGRIPVYTLRTGEKTVKFFKHGSAIRMSYEFDRRASLDILTPFLTRIAREMEKSKCDAAVDLLINGYSGDTDGYGAAPEVNQSTYATPAGFSHTNGTLAWEGFMYWLVQRAKAGVPVDTIIGNWDAWFQWQKLLATPGASMGPTVLQILEAAGVKIDVSGPNVLAANIKFALSSQAPANKLIGITKGEAVEELVEAGSQISESERAILNQSITMVKTENSGFKLIWGDSRGVYDFGQ
jgi:hypothetical protein